MPALLLAILLAAGAAVPPAGPAPRAPGPPPPTDPLERRRAELAEELVKLGLAIQREIEAGDAAALLARVPADGLRCAGQVVPRARIERQLRRTDSWLHRTILAAPGGAPGARPASLRAFFAAAPEVAVLVAFRRDARAGPLGRPCIEYRARDLVAPAAPFCFEARGGRWWFTESLYPCD